MATIPVKITNTTQTSISGTVDLSGANFYGTYDANMINSSITLTNNNEEKLTKMVELLKECVTILNQYSDRKNWSQSNPHEDTLDRFGGSKSHGYELAEEVLEKFKNEAEGLLKDIK